MLGILFLFALLGVFTQRAIAQGSVNTTAFVNPGPNAAGQTRPVYKIGSVVEVQWTTTDDEYRIILCHITNSTSMSWARGNTIYTKAAATAEAGAYNWTVDQQDFTRSPNAFFLMFQPILSTADLTDSGYSQLFNLTESASSTTSGQTTPTATSSGGGATQTDQPGSEVTPTTSSTPTSSSSPSSSSGLSSGASIGIGVGVGIGGIAILALAFLAFRRYRKKKQAQANATGLPTSQQQHYDAQHAQQSPWGQGGTRGAGGEEKPLMGIHAAPPQREASQHPVEMPGGTAGAGELDARGTGGDWTSESGGGSRSDHTKQTMPAELPGGR